jgi:hypothetical protein
MTNPTISSLQKELRIGPSVASRVSQSLDRVRSGSDEIYATPLEAYQNELFKDTMQLVESNADKLDPELKDIEMAQAAKFGPRSIAKPWSERIDSLNAYFDLSKDPDLSKIEQEIANVPRQNLRPTSVNTASTKLKPDTSAGLPFLEKKKFVVRKVAENLSYYLDREDPALLGTRTQEQGKTRNVWMFPIARTLQEMRYFLPLLEFQRERIWRSALRGPEAVDRHIDQIFRSSKAAKRSLVSIDFSSYDASVKPCHQELAFYYFMRLFQLASNSDLEDIRAGVSSIPICTPDGVRYGQHGVPSGTTFTNEVDSVVQWLIGLSSEVVAAFDIQGDDGLYATAHPDVLLRTFSEAGLSVNEEKSVISNHYCVYLQNYYSERYTNEEGIMSGVYPLFRALNRLIFMERWINFSDYEVDGQSYFTIRAFQILENTRNHPLFEDFVKLIYNYDKFKLKYTNSGLKRFRAMERDSRGAGELLSHHYGDVLGKLGNFKVVRLIESL